MDESLFDQYHFSVTEEINPRSIILKKLNTPILLADFIRLEKIITMMYPNREDLITKILFINWNYMKKREDSIISNNYMKLTITVEREYDSYCFFAMIVWI